MEGGKKSSTHTYANDSTKSNTNVLGLQSIIKDVAQTAEKMTDTVVKTVLQPGEQATNGMQQESDTYANPPEKTSEKYIKEIDTNQPQRTFSHPTNSDGSNLKNDVTKSFQSEEDCGCRDAEKNRLTGGSSKPPEPPCPKKLETIKVDMACLRLNNEQKIVLDQGNKN